jgi:hypothetical protein
MTQHLNTRICLYLDRSRVFRWHLWLAEALTAIPGYDISIGFAPDTRPLPKYCFVLFGIERFVYRTNGYNAIDVVDDILHPTPDRGPFDTLIDFSMTNCPFLHYGRILTPCFNGMPGEIGAIASLFGEGRISIEILDNRRTQSWTATPATMDRQIFVRSLDNLLSCAIGMILKALRDPLLTNRPSCPVIASVQTPPMWALLTKVSATVVRKVIGHINKMVSGDVQWSVAWRISSASLLDTRMAKFAVLTDNGNHYYADPFPVRRNGEDFIFIEKFCYASGRGSIAVTKIKDNRPDRAVVVIDEPRHLSYPFIFEDGGEIWMIPESGASRGIDLYRAEKFPYLWKREGRLLDNIEGYDATILRLAGRNGNFDRLWMFVCERMWNSSAWDELSLFSSDSLSGPWRPHPNNPILFNAMLCRPGGAMFVHNGWMLRPVQDCSRIYGGALSLCSVDALDEHGKFSQTVRGVIHADDVLGCHTYNNYTGLEVIDIWGRRRDAVTAYFTERN